MNNRLADLVSRSGIYFAASVAEAMVPLLLMPILTRHLGPAEYGRLAMFQLAIAALAPVVGLGLHSAANRRAYDEKSATATGSDIGAYIGACVKLLAVSSIAATAVVLAFSSSLEALLGIDTVWLGAAVLVAAANVVVGIRQGQWQAHGDARRYGLFQVSAAAATAVFSIGLVLGAGMDADGPMLSQTVIATGFAAVGLMLLRAEHRLTWTSRPGDWKHALAFGLPLVPHLAGYFLLRFVDRAVVNHQLGLAQVGVYLVAVQLALVLRVVVESFNKAYVPWLYACLERADPASLKEVVRGTYGYFVLVLAGAGLAWALGPWTVRLFAGAGFDAAGPLVGLLAMAQAFHGMYLMVTNYVFYSRRTGALALITLATGAANVVMLMVLVSRWGLWGAAAATAIAAALRFGATWALAARRHPMPWVPS